MNSAIVLVVRGMGPVPSFKNRKRIVRGRLITDPRVKRWMDQCVINFASALYSRTPIFGDVTLMDQCQPSSIALCVPEDDCWTCIPEQSAKAVKCAKGNEGALIIIERL